MGCCLSKTQDFNTTQSSHPQFPSSAPESNSHPLRGPLSPVFEEESVKEVLSETPKPKPKPQPQPQPQPQEQLIPLQEDNKKSKKEEKEIPTKIEEEKKVEDKKVEEVNNNVNVAASEEYSDVSEICSLSGSISTTVTERKDDEDGEVSQPRVHRSPAKRIRKRPIPGEFVARHERGSKSPARRLNPSPGRRNDPTQEMGVGVAARRRNSAENNRARRETVERSTVRRSRSPATRTNASAINNNRAGIGCSPSKRAVAPRSPARAPAVKPESDKKVEEETAKEGNETNETIENPLVSMECFIFL